MFVKVIVKRSSDNFYFFLRHRDIGNMVIILLILLHFSSVILSFTFVILVFAIIKLKDTA